MEGYCALKSILVIGHINELQDLYKTHLSKLDIRCDMAAYGHHGLKRLNRKHCAVLIDINSPCKESLMMAKCIRERLDFLANIPIVAISQNDKKQLETLCHQFRINRLIKKPVKNDELSDVLKRYVKF